MDKYVYEQLNDHLYRIVDASGVCCYLVIGKKKACLLDTCSGFGNIKKVVEEITDKPIIVILTHGHHDHMGGSALFDEVYMNLDDLPVFNKFGNINQRLNEAKALFPNETVLPISLVPLRKDQILNIQDNQVFDLGDLHIQMIQVKGHTPGMMCPLICEDRIIIFGDACGVCVLLLDEYSSIVSEYRKSLLHLKEYEDQYDTIYRNHGSFYSSKELLDNVIECCDLILQNKDDQFPVTIHGYDLFAAKEIMNGQRKDGKEGNLLYSLDKVK